MRRNASARRGSEKVLLDLRAVSDVFMLAMGAYTPLNGFMGHDDWRGSCLDMKLTSDVFLADPDHTASQQGPCRQHPCRRARSRSSTRRHGEILAVMEVREEYSIDKKLEAEHVYRTADPKHPGVAKVLAQGDVNLAGPVLVLSEGEYPAKYPNLYIRPAQSRAMFLERGWSNVAAFQTRNPMHRSHEYLVKIAIEVSDGVFIHQVLGKLKAGDIPADVRTRAIQAMIDNYFRPENGHSGGLPDRDALRRSARGVASCPHSPELRLLAPYRWARPCWRRQLLRSLRRTSRL